MILQALKEYYDRKAADPESGIAPEGWELKEIPFIIVLDKKGKLVKIEDTREGDGKKRRAKSFLVPQAVKKASGIKANLLWDVAGYVFGLDTKGKPERAAEQKAAFITRIKEELGGVEDIKPILHFLETANIEHFKTNPMWAEIADINPNLTFRFSDESNLACHKQSIQNALSSPNITEENEGTCLVTGDNDRLIRLHASIKGVYGAQSSGANIVSFNLDAFRSFNKDQGLNAPIGEKAAFAYITAINTLLSKDSTQRMSIGDASTIFWSEKKTDFETDFSLFFSEPPKDNPDASTNKIRALFDSINNGAFINESGTNRFYVLGLAPNAARISIRFWQVGTVAEFAEKIKAHFDDLAIIKPPKEPEYYSIWRLLVNIATQDKSENIPPNIAGDFMRAILTGSLYPATLLQAALRRIHSDTEHRVKPVRAALIKAYLNRYHRIHINPNHKEILMSLDTSQPSIGYQLGRLFAALEKIQEEANPGLNATIRERFYGAACSNPVTVFANLMRLKNHHLAKMESKGRVVNLEKLLAEIVGRFNDFPAHLDLHEQGRFAIGYYHQRQDFFTKKNDTNN
ncbi:MAG: type I-C CRISPR-associated protein Cas8c/Csd1 [Chitinivibrionales bacterium]|nr:type I-C CRISPR-associated protein Cas8c/Csd1 [Chitinivibrionales bacterium]